MVSSVFSKWFARWQEFVGWVPVVALLALVGWVLLPAFAPRLSTDAMSWLIELPILGAYALAASGITYLVWRRWRFTLTDEQQEAYWSALLVGARGAVVVFIVNAVVWVSCFGLVLWFFSPR